MNNMEKTMKNTILATALTLVTLSASAAVHDLQVQGYTGRYCVGDTLSYHVGGEFVEKILVSAEGIRNDGFIKVYADGQLVQNIGVPGYDPDYSFRVRQNVENITLKFEETCSRVLDMKIFTEDNYYNNDRSFNHGSDYLGTEWGTEVQAIVESMVERTILSEGDLWNEFLKPLQVLALQYDAVAVVSDLGDLKAAYYALSMAKLISDKQDDLLDYASNRTLRRDVKDLIKVKEAILEAYDVKERKLEQEIEGLEELL